MREQRITLEHRIDVAFVRRHAVDLFAVEEDISLIWLDKAADNAQSGRLAAARWAEEGDKLLVVDIQIDALEHSLTVKFHHHIFQADQNIFFHLLKIPLFPNRSPVAAICCQTLS